MFQPESVNLTKGNHKNPEEGMCVMEAVAYFANEGHTDHPKCACPVLTNYMIKLNDSMDDINRQKLKPYILKLAGTNDGKDLERSKVLAWASITKFAPAALRIAGFKEYAKKLENTPYYDFDAASDAARVAADASYAAGDAASAASYAGDASYAASGASYASAASCAASAASYASDTAIAAAYAAGDAKTTIWDMAIAALEEALKV